MAKTTFVDNQIFPTAFANSIYGSNAAGGHRHDGADNDGHAGKINLAGATDVTGELPLANVVGLATAWAAATIAVDDSAVLKIEAAAGGGTIDSIDGSLIIQPRFKIYGKTAFINGAIRIATVTGTVNCIRIYVRDTGSALKNPVRTAIDTYTMHNSIGSCVFGLSPSSLLTIPGPLFSIDDSDGLYMHKYDYAAIIGSTYLGFHAVYEIA